MKKQQKFFRNPSVSFADSVLNSQWSCRCARKLACGSPLLIGLIGSYCSHWLRCLFRPPYTGEPLRTLKTRTRAKQARAVRRKLADLDVYKRQDVLKPASLDAFFAHGDGENLIVIHCAGVVSIASRFIQKVYDVNFKGTQNIVEMCETYGAKKLVYVSSVQMCIRDSLKAHG